MFEIKHYNDEKEANEFIELFSSEKNCFAKFFLNEGASLQELRLSNINLIKSIPPLKYNDIYNSSILFPFANRIKDGCYEFDGISYQFEINEKALNNALHGLVYNKTFELIDKKATEDSATVKLVYHERKGVKGFPFTYSIFLEYKLKENTLDLNVKVKNTSLNPFPFTIGWHPYFLSSDLFNSSLTFDSNKKMKLDNRCITESIVDIDSFQELRLKGQLLDDCYLLNSNTILFSTPKYNLTLNSSEVDSYLQLYTPAYNNIIAIEPTTGVSDSFNNNIGLKKLQPNNTYSIDWNLKIKNKN